MSQITKQALAAALKELLKERPLSRITIADLTEACGISRMTFYYHFQDIFDLIRWICREEGGRALQGRKDYGSWQEGLAALCRAVVENRAFIQGVYHSVEREQVENYLYRVAYGLLYDVVEELARGCAVSREDREYVAHFFKYAFVGILLEWVRTGMKEPPEEVAGRFSRMARGLFSAALRNLSDLPPEGK